MSRRVRLRQVERRQVEFREECLDDVLEAGHEARLVWRVVESLNLRRFYEDIKAVDGEVGRDATDPKILIALWLYATIEGVGSARELERLCRKHDAYRWIVGRVSINYHLLSDFRVQFEAELDNLLTQVVARLVKQGLVDVKRVSQDGMRVRASAGASSFRRESTLGRLLVEAKKHVRALKRQPEEGVSNREKAAQERAALEREERIKEAIAEIVPQVERREKLARKIAEAKDKEIRASTTDPEARVMKMPDGGFRPAYNFQFGADVGSRAIVGVSVTNRGVDNGQLFPMKEQIETRTGLKIEEYLVDGGYTDFADLDKAAESQMTLYLGQKKPRNEERKRDPSLPRPEDSPAVAAWRKMMQTPEAKEIYKERAATSETINADLRAYRGLTNIKVRGTKKALCIGLWGALAYNLLHFGEALIR